MKTLYNLLIFLCVGMIFACTDKKKEEAEMQERLETIEEIDSTVEAINLKIEQDMKELEEALEELDSI